MKDININNKLKRLKAIKDNRAKILVAASGINQKSKKSLKKKEVNYFFNVLTNYIKQNKLAKIKKTEKQFINKKKEQKKIQGIKHMNFLPVRGQRSKTNAKTQKKKRTNYKNFKKIKNEKKKGKKKWQFIDYKV